ncbi:uncharacterized protein LOC123322647 [Coccinella septempunctata]|uniref:uncharacterized protein LOC123322647 n=1 Tax=Coccinella septempunctata TaxID=41139 RepID=UPI001D09072D|nr:uncharacterized protein LOC123322647 [Coccinella septempunctata]
MSQQRASLSNSSSRNDYCCVPKCSSWSRKNPDLSFHKFPHEGKERVHMEGTELVDRRKAWILRLNLGKPASKFMKVCSLHFTHSDYLQKDGNSGRGRVLKRIAVPSKKLPQTSPAPTSKIFSNKRYMEKSWMDLKYRAYCFNERSEQELIAAEALVQLVNAKSEIKELIDKVVLSTYKTSISL